MKSPVPSTISIHSPFPCILLLPIFPLLCSSPCSSVLIEGDMQICGVDIKRVLSILSGISYNSIHI